MGADRRPFCGGDAVHVGVPQCPICMNGMTAENAIVFCAEPFDGHSALSVERGRAKFDGDAADSIECMREQKDLRLGVDSRSLRALAVPGRADLDAPIHGIDVHVCGHPDGFIRRAFDHGERDHRTASGEGESAHDLGVHLRWIGHARVPQIPKLTITRGLDQVVLVNLSERFEPDRFSDEAERLEPMHARERLGFG